MLLASAVSISLVTAARAEIFYVYDDLSRLIAVVDEQGNAATYTYDAVGNILKIDRFDAAQQPGPVRITLVTPTAGRSAPRSRSSARALAPLRRRTPWPSPAGRRPSPSLPRTAS